MEELLRRIMVSELIGNYDAHLKNFSFLYDLDGRTPRLWLRTQFISVAKAMV